MIVDCAYYKDGARQHEGPIPLEQAAEHARGDGEFVWIGLHEPEPEDLKRLQELFGLHELAVEDAARPHQRPKLEDYDESWFIVLRTAHYHEDDRAGPLRRDPRVRRARLRDHRAPRPRQRAQQRARRGSRPGPTC